MAILCKLAKPDEYRVSTWNLAEHPDMLAYWLDLFASFPARFDKHLLQADFTGDDFNTHWSRFENTYRQGLKAIGKATAANGHLGTIELCRFRQATLNEYGFFDPYSSIKQKENELAARIYPDLIAQIDATELPERWELLLKGVLAGNMFDLGAPDTIEMYQQGKADFFSSLKQLPSRPWFVDDADAWLKRVLSPGHWRQGLFFVDNAGADIVLGVMPLVREMARGGIRVVLTPNSEPALNDITLGELNPLLKQLAERDHTLARLLADGLISTVASGGDTPLIELGQITDECNEAAAESDLIVLQGMGRGIESNWTEPFACDVWRVALLKDRTVAKWIGANLFDAVCRFDPIHQTP